MWFGNYDENGINVGDVVYGVVTGVCSAGIFLSLEDGQEAFARFGGLEYGAKVPCTVLKKASETWRRVLVGVDSFEDVVAT